MNALTQQLLHAIVDDPHAWLYVYRPTVEQGRLSLPAIGLYVWLLSQQRIVPAVTLFEIMRRFGVTYAVARSLVNEILGAGLRVHVFDEVDASLSARAYPEGAQP